MNRILNLSSDKYQTKNKKIALDYIYLYLLNYTQMAVNQRIKEGKGEIFQKSPDVKIIRMVSIFNKLPLNFQDYALEQLEGVLKLRGKK